MATKSFSPLAELRTKIQLASSVITKDTRVWLWLRSHVLDDAKLRLSLQSDDDAHTGPAGFLGWCGRHKLKNTFSRLISPKSLSEQTRRRNLYAFAAKVLAFAAVICAPGANYEVKETAEAVSVCLRFATLSLPAPNVCPD
jgi:hypothetical protein